MIIHNCLIFNFITVFHQISFLDYLNKKRINVKNNLEITTIERAVKMNHKWMKLLSTVFLSMFLLLGCNNGDDDNNPPPEDVTPGTEEPIEDPEDATDPDTIDENNVTPDTEESIEDAEDATDPDNIDENNDNTDTEEPIEDPKDVNDADNKDE
ncbi:hypothetical protein KIS1582_5165 [Cytobacillus firmus]|nr:hypothetical protein KIS1582_5165 [Cytobacillus firmus]